MVFKNLALALSIPLLALAFNLNKKTLCPVINRGHANLLHFDGVCGES